MTEVPGQENYARYDYAWKTPAWTVQSPAYVPGSPSGYYDPGLPPDVSKVRLYGTPLDWETGRPLEAVLSIRCTSILRYTPTGQQVMPGVRKQRFRANDGINLVLAATDDPQLTGEPGWQYEARLTVKGVTQEFRFSLPSTPDEVSIFSLIPDQVEAAPTE